MKAVVVTLLVLTITAEMLVVTDLFFGRLLERNHIKLSVAVYPWPGQLLYDKPDSLQVRIWRGFCATGCSHFYNAFPAFFEKINQYGQKETIRRYFLADDVHFNTAGSEIVARNFLQTSGLTSR